MKRAPLANARIAADQAEPLLVAVSGGRDSMVLLHWLNAAGFKKLIACHLDHCLRTDSAADAHFVADAASRLGIPCESSSADVGTLAKNEGLSIEAAGREARYGFFAEVATRTGCDRIALAHHADDQVETFLFNLLRGAGPGGLSGMQLVSKRDGLILLRPFLPVWRADIERYAAAHGVKFREDPSNASRDFTRNRLRLDAIPALTAAMARDVRQAIHRAAGLLAAEDEFLAAQPALASIPEVLETRAIAALPLALQRRLVHAWLALKGIPAGFGEVESVLSLLTIRVAKVNLPGGRHARRRGGRIFVEG